MEGIELWSDGENLIDKLHNLSALNRNWNNDRLNVNGNNDDSNTNGYAFE